jgi:D-aminoacyl-tRNA deacylase
MRVLLQRVSQARVWVDGQVVGEIGRGVCLLVGCTHTDTPAEAAWLAQKVATLRIFEDTAGKMNLSLADVQGDILVVSQFTLYGDAVKGRRPSFTDSANTAVAEPLYQQFIHQLRQHGFTVQTGQFGATMQVELTNDGPVTLMLERESDKP